MCSHLYPIFYPCITLLPESQRLRLVEVCVELGRTGKRVLPGRRSPSTRRTRGRKRRFIRLGCCALARLRRIDQQIVDDRTATHTKSTVELTTPRKRIGLDAGRIVRRLDGAVPILDKGRINR